MSNEAQGTKNPLNSKTYWTAFLSPLIVYFGNKVPLVGEFLTNLFTNDPTIVTALICALFAALRTVTKDKIVIK